VKSSHAQQRLRALVYWEGDIIVLTDPDAGGRMLRIFLDDALRCLCQQVQQQQQQQQGSGAHQAATPSVLHAFVRINDAISVVSNRWA